MANFAELFRDFSRFGGDFEGFLTIFRDFSRILWDFHGMFDKFSGFLKDYARLFTVFHDSNSF